MTPDETHLISSRVTRRCDLINLAWFYTHRDSRLRATGEIVIFEPECNYVPEGYSAVMLPPTNLSPTQAYALSNTIFEDDDDDEEIEANLAGITDSGNLFGRGY